ncbi:DUF255 domain-containing protein [Desulfoscipio sp. XC116]
MALYIGFSGSKPPEYSPWCDEAFVKAKAEDKPVFLSIGYKLINMIL